MMTTSVKKIFLSSRYSRNKELRGYAFILSAMGFGISCRWIEGNHQISDEGLSLEAKSEERTRFALEDYDDLQAADCVLAFTEAPRSVNSRGGRHVEFGMGVALKKTMIVIGPRENVFHALPQVKQYETWCDFLADIERYIGER